jgi:hypothetical protein
MKIPYQSKLYFSISLLGIICSFYLAYNLNFNWQDYSNAEKLRLNFLNIFIFLISSLSLYKTYKTFQSRIVDSSITVESKLTLIKKFSSNENLGIISETENEIELIYKSKFLGFYKMRIFVNKNSFEFNAFQLGGKPFDWGIRVKLLKKFESYISNV